MNLSELIELASSGQTLSQQNDFPSDLFQALYLTAMQAYESGDYGLAEDRVMQAIVVDHSRAEGWALLGNTYRDCGLFVEAIQAWQAAFILGEDPRVALAMAHTARVIGFNDQARQFAEAAIVFGVDDEKLIDQVNALLVDIALKDAS